MGNEGYFHITNSDGDVIVYFLSRDEVEKMINEEEHEFAGSDQIMGHIDMNYIRGELLIKGRIILPVAEQMVTQWRLPE